jgi:hypothetical protein
MGSPVAQVVSSTQPQGKGFASPAQPNAVDGKFAETMTPVDQLQQPQGKGSNVTYPGQGGQPKMGQPNMYPNTVGQWDNASIQSQQSRNSGGKGKG